MSDNDTDHGHPAYRIAEALDSRDWNLNADELHKSFLDLVGAVIAVAREVASVAAAAKRANDRLDSIDETCKQLMDKTRTDEAKFVGRYGGAGTPRGAAPDDRLVDPSAANARHDGEAHDDTDARLGRLLANMEEQSSQETLRRELEHARQYQTRAKLAEYRVDYLYRNLVDMWRVVRCAEEDAQAPEQLRKALASIQTRLRATLEAAGKLPPE